MRSGSSQRRAIVTSLGLLATIVAAEAAVRFPRGLDLYRPVPDSNVLTPAKIALGKRLFSERRLSRDGTLSCAGCHDPRRAFANNRVVAEGIGRARGTRNVPAILNRAWGTSFFWDGRVTTLEQQALQPILNSEELAMMPDGVLAVARSPRYLRDFRTVFGQDPTLDDVARAIAAYVRTIVAGDSPYDRFTDGDVRALSAPARRGLQLFRGKGGCTSCHVGPTFSDEQFHNTGVAWRTGTATDQGRGGVTHRLEDVGAFKTPTLRELRQTAPYMHDGSLATLEEVVDYYDSGGAQNSALDASLRPLHLSPGEKQDLAAFLKSLSGTIRDGR
jgi:cytochrome c peroxidase